MKKLVFVFIFCFSSFHCFTQSAIIDSLKIALNNAKHDSVRCLTLSALIDNEYDYKIWPAYNEQLYQISEKNIRTSNSKRLQLIYIKYYAMSINNKGYLYLEYGDNKKALEYFFRALTLCEQNNDKFQIATNINNIAYIYKSQGNINKALELINRALKIEIEIGDSNKIALTYNNLASIYKIQNKKNLSFYYFKKALDIQKKLGNKEGMAIGLGNLGGYYFSNGDYIKSIAYYSEALKVRKKLNDMDGISNNLTHLAEVYYDLNKLNEASKYAIKSFKISEQLNYAENKRNSALILYKIYKRQNKNSEALKMHELYIQMRDSIKNEENLKSSFEKEIQYQYNKKATTDSIRTIEEKKVVSAQLKQEKTQRFALYGGLLFAGLFGAFMFNRFKVTKKQNGLIQEQKTELQKQKDIVDNHQKETLDSIHYAKRIQNALIANSNFINEHVPNNFIYFNPKDIVSGDFYWATLHNHKFYLAICDSTGHGVPGAFMSLLNMGFLSEAIKEKNIEKPNDIFNYVRERLINTISNEGQKDGMDGILICIDKKNNIIEYCAANNEPILIHNNEILELPKDKMPVGKGEKVNSFTLHTIELKQDDTLYLYTDGFADQFGGPKGKKFMYKRLNEFLLSLKDVPIVEQKQLLETTFHNWKGDLEQIDDVLIIGLKHS